MGHSLSWKRHDNARRPSSNTALASCARAAGTGAWDDSKTVANWRKGCLDEDQKLVPKEPCSTVLTEGEEVIIAAFRHHTLLPLDGASLPSSPDIPHLSRSAQHRCLQ